MNVKAQAEKGDSLVKWNADCYICDYEIPEYNNIAAVSMCYARDVPGDMEMKTSVLQYPLYPRSALELFDVSLKLYKKYFWPLSGVSAIVWITILPAYCYQYILVLLPMVLIAFFFALPFLYGATGHCLEAAINGHSVSFKECVRFAWLRYKLILWSQIVAVVVAIICWTIYFLLLQMFVAFKDYSTILEATAYVLAFLALFVFWIIGFYLFASFTLMPLLACVEDQSMSIMKLVKRSLGISYCGFKKVLTLIFAHSLGVLVSGIVLVNFADYVEMAINLQNVSQGHIVIDSSLLFLIEIAFSFTILGILWLPFYLLSLGAFYIDVRIRNEAFDLEYQFTHPDRI